MSEGDRIDRLEAKIDRLAEQMLAGFGRVQADVAELKADLAAFRYDTDRRLVAVEARLDEQRQTINALIPTNIAAIPGKRSA
ncbi:MAG: hypothetical protein H7840_03760 [Alphaproteobacteria bacterium]